MQENHNMWGKPMRAAGTGTALFLQARLAPHIYECAYQLNSAVRENGICRGENQSYSRDCRVKMHEKGHCQTIQPLISIISCTDSRFPLSPLYTLQSSLSPAIPVSRMAISCISYLCISYLIGISVSSTSRLHRYAISSARVFPPRMWKWRCCTVWPASAPQLLTTR